MSVQDIQARRRAAESARMELQVQADAAQRANSSITLIVLASILLAISAGYAVWGWMKRSGAAAEVRIAWSEAQREVREVEGLRALLQREAAIARPQDPQVNRKLEGLAMEAGLNIRVPDRPLGTPNAAGLSQRLYAVQFAGQDPEPVIGWLASVISSPELEGLSLTKLEFRPSVTGRAERRDGWDISVELARWERR